MPNFDGGHYFLTALIPIKSAEYVEQDGRKNSPVHMVRNALAVLPKARQSPVTEQTGFNSPFARNTRTHFARLFVIDDVINNGRNPVNALKVAIGSRLGQASAVRLNPTTQQPYDQLSQPYLVFVADFDASSGDDGELKSYLRELWQTMREELCSILKYCEGFDCKRASAETFYEYVKSCQVETTMSFNDYEYRLDTPGLRSISIPLLVAWAAAAALAALAGLLGTLIAVIRAWPDFDTLTDPMDRVRGSWSGAALRSVPLRAPLRRAAVRDGAEYGSAIHSQGALSSATLHAVRNRFPGPG